MSIPDPDAEALVHLQTRWPEVQSYWEELLGVAAGAMSAYLPAGFASATITLTPAPALDDASRRLLVRAVRDVTGFTLRIQEVTE